MSQSAGSNSSIPCPTHELRAALESFPNAEELVWVQEEPENMGVWEFIRPACSTLPAGARCDAWLARAARARRKAPRRATG